MQKWIAFLRAINVGGRNIKMEELKTIFREMGFSGVETFIASGNVIFEAKAAQETRLEQKIETCLQKVLGYEVAVFLRKVPEVRAITREEPRLRKKVPRELLALNVGFLKEPLTGEKRALLQKLETDIDSFEAKGRELYWLCLKKQSDSKCSNGFLERKLGVKLTFRGMATVEKLGEKLEIEG